MRTTPYFSAPTCPFRSIRVKPYNQADYPNAFNAEGSYTHSYTADIPQNMSNVAKITKVCHALKLLKRHPKAQTAKENIWLLP